MIILVKNINILSNMKIFLQIKQICLCLAFFLLLMSCSATITSTTTNLVCSSPGTMTWSYTQPTMPEFDEANYFYDYSTGDTLQVYLKYGGDGTNNYKLIAYDNTFTTLTTKEIETSSATTMKLIKFINNYVILKDTSANKYYLSRYETSATVTSPLKKYEITIPSVIGGIGSLTKFIPMLLHNPGEFLQGVPIMFCSATQSVIYDQFWPTGAQTALYAEIKGSVFNYEFGQIQGNFHYFYDVKNNRIISQYSPSTTYTGTKVVKAYSLRYFYLVLSISEPDKLSGSLIHYASGPTPLSNPASTTPYADYSDGVSNFIRTSSVQLIWVNQRPGSDSTYISTFTAAELNVASILDISLTGNKAVLMYANKLDYYRMTGTNTIELILTKSYTQSDLTIGTQGEWKIGISCLCQSIRRFSCSSATLNCIILRKAGGVCGNKVDDLTQ